MNMRGEEEREARWLSLKHASNPFKSFNVLSIVFPWKRDPTLPIRRREIPFENTSTIEYKFKKKKNRKRRRTLVPKWINKFLIKSTQKKKKKKIEENLFRYFSINCQEL